MMSLRTLKVVGAAAALAALVATGNAEDTYTTTHSCSDCLDGAALPDGESGVYCKGSGFFEGSNVCVPESDFGKGFFKGCDDFSFGSKKLGNKVDCAFNARAGEVILAFIIIVALCCCAGGSWFFCVRNKNGNNNNNGGNRQPAPNYVGNTTANVGYRTQGGVPTSVAPSGYGGGGSYGGGGASYGGAAVAPPAYGQVTDGGSMATQITNLESLKAQGLLTEEEFQAGKAKVIGL